MTPIQAAELLDRNGAQIMRVLVGGIDAASRVGLLSEWVDLKKSLLSFHDALAAKYDALRAPVAEGEIDRLRGLLREAMQWYCQCDGYCYGDTSKESDELKARIEAALGEKFD